MRFIARAFCLLAPRLRSSWVQPSAVLCHLSQTERLTSGHGDSAVAAVRRRRGPIACLPACIALLLFVATLPLEHSASSAPALLLFRTMSRQGANTSFPPLPVRAPGRTTNPEGDAARINRLPRLSALGVPCPRHRPVTPTTGQALQHWPQWIWPACTTWCRRLCSVPLSGPRLHADDPPEPRLNWANESADRTPVRPGSAQRPDRLSASTSSTMWMKASTGGRTWTLPPSRPQRPLNLPRGVGHPPGASRPSADWRCSPSAQKRYLRGLSSRSRPRVLGICPSGAIAHTSARVSARLTIVMAFASVLTSASAPVMATTSATTVCAPTRSRLDLSELRPLKPKWFISYLSAGPK